MVVMVCVWVSVGGSGGGWRREGGIPTVNMFAL